MKNKILPLIFISFCSYGKTGIKQLAGPYTPPARTIGEKSYLLNLKTDYFASEGSYDIDGNKASLNDGDSFTEMNIDANLTYGVTPSFDMNGGFIFRSITSAGTFNSLTHDSSESGLKSYYVTGKYSFNSKSDWLVAISGMVEQMAFSTTSYDDATDVPEDKLVLGDDGTKSNIMLHATYYKSKNIYLNASAGLQMYSTGQSNEIPYNLESGFIFKRVSLRFGIDGISSLGGDQYGRDSAIKPYTGVQNTAMYNSINRSYMAPFAAIGFHLGQNWAFEFKGSRITSAEYYDYGNRLELSINFYGLNTKTAAQKRKETFKTYEEEADITKVSPKGTLFKIDKGSKSNISENSFFDIFYTKDGKDILIGKAKVYKLRNDEAVLQIIQLYNKVRINTEHYKVRLR